jgi:hypothetical protein
VGELENVAKIKRQILHAASKTRGAGASGVPFDQRC